jgi:hypothetical protein
MINGTICYLFYLLFILLRSGGGGGGGEGGMITSDKPFYREREAAHALIQISRSADRSADSVSPAQLIHLETVSPDRLLSSLPRLLHILQWFFTQVFLTKYLRKVFLFLVSASSKRAVIRQPGFDSCPAPLPRPSSVGILQRLWSQWIDSKEWIPPAYVAWRAGTIALFLLGS